MRTARHRGLAAIGVAAASALALAGCGTAETAGGGGDDAGGEVSTVTVGSQDYYSNEIIAEIYAQALEGADVDVERQMRIGQRDVYLDALEGGEIQLIPDYTGNLLQFYDEDTEARSSEDVAAALPDVLPDSFTALDYAEAQDADSYNVTAEFSEENGITSLADLADYDGDVTVGGNAELESRPYGPDGLQEFYGVEVGFSTIGDSGGPLTKDAIRSGDITMGDIYTADPDLASGDFVTLEDPENMILAQNVVPLAAAGLSDEAIAAIDAVTAELTTDALIELNVQSVVEERDAAGIATEWLESVGLA